MRQRPVGRVINNSVKLGKMEVKLKTDYLIDVAYYLMFEYMFPSVEEASFKSTNSNESADIDGISDMEIKAELSKDY